MKVAHVITGLGIGGAEKVALDIISGLDNGALQQQMLSLTRYNAAIEHFEKEDATVNFIDDHGILALFGLRQAIQILRRIEPDIVHAHMFHGLVGSVFFRLFCKKQYKIIFTSHLEKYSMIRSLIVWALRYARSSDTVLVDKGPVWMNRTDAVLISNGVECVPPREHIHDGVWPSPVKLVSVGRLEPQKDPIGLLHAVKEADLGNWQLDFIGDGHLAEKLRKAISKLNLEQRVRILGRRKDVLTMLTKYDLYCQFSKFEGMPISILEAGAASLPVVATAVGSNPTVLGGGRGWAVAPSQFSRTLRCVYDDPSGARMAGRNLHDYVSTYCSLERMLAAYEKLYLGLK